MTVYVDDMCDSPLGQFGRMKMSHMIADSTEELLAMADRIGVARRWIQHAGTPREHFDIAKSKRAAAIAAGAVPVTMRELAQKTRARRPATCDECRRPAGEQHLSWCPVQDVEGPLVKAKESDLGNLPYETSTAGQSREREIRDTLRGVGATAVGFMQDDDSDMIIAQFRLNGREVTIPLRIGAYADAWLRENPHNSRMKSSVKQHQHKARQQAERAVWAVLADWIKAQAAMMTCGLMDAETAFLPHVHLQDGRRVVESITADDGPLRLPPPKN